MSEEERRKRGPGRPPVANPKKKVYGGLRMDEATYEAAQRARADGVDLQALMLAFLRRTLKAKGYLKQPPTD